MDASVNYSADRSGWRGPVGVFARNPAYRRYMTGNAVSLIGTWMQRTGTAWLAWELGGNATSLAAVALAGLLPTFLVGPFAGTLADRLDRRRLLFWTQSLLSLHALLLWALTATGVLGIAGLVAMATVSGVLTAFNQPVRLAYVPSLVASADLASAVAVNSTLFNTSRFIGPALAAPILAAGGTAWVFLINAISFVAFLTALHGLKPVTADPPVRSRRGITGDTLDGLRWSLSHPGLGPIFLLAAAAAIGLRPIGELLPAVADRLLGAQAHGFAMLSAAFGAGAIAAGLRLSVIAPERPILTSLAMAPLAAAAAAALLVAPGFVWGVAAVAVLGFAVASAGIGAQSQVQLTATPEMRGRTLSLYGMLFRGAPALGAAVTGPLADAIGLRSALAVGIALFLAAWAWVLTRREAMLAGLRLPATVDSTEPRD